MPVGAEGTHQMGPFFPQEREPLGSFHHIWPSHFITFIKALSIKTNQHENKPGLNSNAAPAAIQ